MKKILNIIILLIAFSPLTQVFAETPSDIEEPEIETDTPVSHEEIEGDQSLTSTREWRPPVYTGQEQALGWTENSFAVPAGLETQVKFWIDIYSKYSSDQGVLHDSEYIDLIYTTLDFSTISSRSDINAFQKERLKIRLVKEAKKQVIEMLKKFEKLESSESLSESEKKIWDYFQKIDEKKKFREAMDKSRLRFQLGQKDRIVQGIFFSGRYLEDFEKVFKDAGLPIELTRLPFVESSFNVLARSKVGASGIWQIMPKTGRPYLMINKAIDKRNLPSEATKLAAKLLRFNFSLLESWPLAVTGYNHGPHGVLRLTKHNKSRELVDLWKNRNSKKRLGFASRNFFASFLAVLEVEKNATKYLGPVKWSQSLNAANITLNKNISYSQLLHWFDGDDHRAQIFNPHITSLARKNKIQLPKGAVISIPAAKESEVKLSLNLDQKIGLDSKTR